MKQTLFCFGYGFTAQVLAQRLSALGWTIYASARSGASEARILEDGCLPVRIGADGDLSVPEASHWLISAPPREGVCPALKVLADRADRPDWIGYLSTTGVYGDLGGGWAFEWSPVNPQNDRSRWRVEAEQNWLSFDPAAQMFRLAGIYGPGRSAIDRVRAGTAKRIIKPGQVFSRIHVEDIASVLECSIAQPYPGRVYNVCDDDPAPPQDVIAYAAELLGHPVPPDIPIASADLSPMAKSFYAECKRVSNARAKSELGWTLRYPSYREGLKSICSAI